jgi:hypothetical protein
MNNLIKTTLLSCIFICGFARAEGTQFTDELKVFQPYLGNWSAVFKSENGVPTLVDVSKWERALNGKALRTLHSINNGEYGGESIIFFDKAQQKLVFYYFTTADFFTQGTIEVIGENEFVAYEDVSGNADGVTQVRSTSRLTDNEMHVSTSYLKHGKWTKPEVRLYKRTSDKVIFK